MVGSDLLVVVVGNKADLARRRAVQRDTAQAYAASIGAIFIETSAFTEFGELLSGTRGAGTYYLGAYQELKSR